MMWGSVDGGGWWMLWGSIMMILFWGGIIALVVWVVQSLSNRPSGDAGSGGTGGAKGETPQEIAARRYARGEITSEEYARIVNDLRQHGAGVT